MFFLADFSLPLRDPVPIFTIVLLIILISPLLLSKIRVPGIVGLILAGALVGPNGLGIFPERITTLLESIGLMYIMFLAGLEIDLNDFKKNRNKSLVFGAVTFLLPITIGTLVNLHVLGFTLSAAVLVANMFSTHTLVAYPIASRLGITKNEAVNITVGGTIITDTVALLVLTVIAGSAKGDLTWLFGIRLFISLLIFGFIVIVVFPLIARWFFRNVEGEGILQYIFVLTIVFVSATLAEVAGVEPIIGAFLAGIAVNRLIPHSSPLMNRIGFVGNALFIPVFLIGVGMLIDPRVVFKGPWALIVAGTLTVVAISTKWLAAFFVQKLFNYSNEQRNLIFGLSSAHAAATIAIILIGYNLNIVDENVLNGTVVLILVTCLVASFVTDRAGRKIAVQEAEEIPEVKDLPEKILVPIANPATIEKLIDLAVLIKDAKSLEPIYPLSVINDDKDAKEQILKLQKLLHNGVEYANASENSLYPIFKVEINTADGIIRAVKEMMITHIVIGWNGKFTAKDRFFGSLLKNVLRYTEQMLIVTKLLYPLSITKKIMVVVPPNAEAEFGFKGWLQKMVNLGSQTSGDLHFYSNPTTLEKIRILIKKLKPSVPATMNEFGDWENFSALKEKLDTNDLLVIVEARENTISYRTELERLPRILAKDFTEINFLIIYPEQKNYIKEGLESQY